MALEAWKTVYIADSKSHDNFHTSMAEAIKFLKEREASEIIDILCTKGINKSVRIARFDELVNRYLAYCEKIPQSITHLKEVK